MRKFIPTHEIRPGVDYTGYVARSDGLHHWTEARALDNPNDPTGPSYMPRTIFVGPAPDWGELPDLKKRTERERVESLVKRMVSTVEKIGHIPDSIMRDLQGELAVRGNLYSIEDLRAIAAVYLRRAAAEEERKERGRIVRSR